MEPPRPRVPGRPSPPLLSSPPIARRGPAWRVRRGPTPTPEPAAGPVAPAREVAFVPTVAAVAATTLALASRGDIIVLAVLLAVVAARRARVVAVALACGAVLVRWGSSSLGAIAGAQAVLGPAGWTGSGPAVASAWLAAIAVVACVPATDTRPAEPAVLRVAALVIVAPFALTAADICVGPALGGAVVARVGASLAALVVAWLVTGVARTPRRTLALDVVTVVAGAAALVLAGVGR